MFVFCGLLLHLLCFLPDLLLDKAVNIMLKRKGEGRGGRRVGERGEGEGEGEREREGEGERGREREREGERGKEREGKGERKREGERGEREEEGKIK